LQLGARGLLAAGNYLINVPKKDQAGTLSQRLVSAAGGLLKAVEDELNKVQPSPQSATKMAARGDLAAFHSAVEEGGGILPGFKRFGPSLPE
jgi:hypothetical protein